MHPRSCDAPRSSFVLPTTARTAIAICFCVGFADGVILPFLTLGTEHAAHLTARFVSPLLAYYFACELLATPVLSEAADRHGRRRTLVFSLAGVGTRFLLLPFAVASSSLRRATTWSTGVAIRRPG